MPKREYNGKNKRWRRLLLLLLLCRPLVNSSVVGRWKLRLMAMWGLGDNKVTWRGDICHILYPESVSCSWLFYLNLIGCTSITHGPLKQKCRKRYIYAHLSMKRFVVWVGEMGIFVVWGWRVMFSRKCFCFFPICHHFMSAASEAIPNPWAIKWH